MEAEHILLALTLLFGFYMAWNIGANDVANAMGTSVGSRALTLKKAIFIAAIFEFGGAYLVGSHVSETIQSGIVNPDMFSQNPMIFGFGMIAALIATGAWLQIASFFGLPVSTTHAIVGAILGFGLIIGGFSVVHWAEVGSIVASWVFSPLLSGAISFIIFSFLQRKILYVRHPVQAAKRIAPYFIGFSFVIFSLSIMYDGLKNLHLDLPFKIAIIISLLVGFVGTVISYAFLRKLSAKHTEPIVDHDPLDHVSLEKALKHLRRVGLQNQKEQQKALNEVIEKTSSLRDTVHEKTKLFEIATPFKDVERVFSYLQIISASLVAFAHGANDVANAIGPVAAVFDLIRTKTLSTVSVIPNWLLLMGGVGIVIGLATWGWRVIETIGRKITELTPTRGFSAEFGAAMTILFASKLGLPISTTHALVGSVLGVGLARGFQALNLRTLRDVVISWIVTLPVCAMISILFFYLLQFLFAEF